MKIELELEFEEVNINSEAIRKELLLHTALVEESEARDYLVDLAKTALRLAMSEPYGDRISKHFESYPYAHMIPQVMRLARNPDTALIALALVSACVFVAGE